MAGSELIFKALADTTRQRLLQVLSLQDLSVSELVAVLRLPQSTVSRHLKVLREARLLVDCREGNTVTYAARPVLPGVTSDAADATSSRDGDVGLLRNRLLEWVGRSPLEEDVRRRLDRVVRTREAGRFDFFEAVGARWDQLRREAFGEAFPFEALTWLLPSDWVVADIGAGTGYMLASLASRFRRVIAVDPSPRMLEIAKGRPEVAGVSNLEFRLGVAQELPLADGEIDLAIGSLVLHHVERPMEALKALRRCLSVAGKLMIIEQEPRGDETFHDRMGDVHQGFERADLTAWAEAAGFRRIMTRELTTGRPGARYTGKVPKLFVLIGDAGMNG